MFRVFCPKFCKNEGGLLFGSSIYTESSPICLAAIHDGKLKDDQGGELRLKLMKGVHHYPSTKAFDIES